MLRSGRLSLLILPLSLALAGFGVQPAKEPADWEQLLIEIASAYSPLSECMQTELNSSAEEATVLLNRLAEQGDADAIERDAVSVLGQSSPSVIAARTVGLEPLQRVSLLLMAMAQAALDPEGSDDEVTKSDVLSFKALVLSVTHIASATDGRCEPSQNLLYWMDEVPHADS